MSEYKYYILDKGNNNVSGVISDDNGIIKYEDLHLGSVFNEFTSSYENQLIKYSDSPIRETDADKLVDQFENVEITKDYWVAYFHAGGQKRKAVSQSTES